MYWKRDKKNKEREITLQLDYFEFGHLYTSLWDHQKEMEKAIRGEGPLKDMWGGKEIKENICITLAMMIKEFEKITPELKMLLENDNIVTSLLDDEK